MICFGVGGDDVIDFVEMFMCMYLCWVEWYKYLVKVMDIFYVEGVGIKLVMFEIDVFYVFGIIFVEVGMYCFVCISFFGFVDKW